MSVKTISCDELIPGYKFPPATYELSASLVSKYLKAVDSAGDGFVPPLAITACAIAAMTKSFAPPSGAVVIHASQELEFFKLVPIGATIECHTRVAQKITRSKMSMLILEHEVFDEGKEKVQSGRATIALPA
ncbi:MAG: MaoC family dehydratase [Chloroflexi bacterium]|nr:MaoC family dehydratase [Chloroflexota bacterium]